MKDHTLIIIIDWFLFFALAVQQNYSEFPNELKEMPQKVIACIGLAMHQVRNFCNL